jgi:hypothetical protein
MEGRGPVERKRKFPEKNLIPSFGNDGALMKGVFLFALLDLFFML